MERRGVIERREAWSEVQLNSERIAVEAGPEVDLVFNSSPTREVARRAGARLQSGLLRRRISRGVGGEGEQHFRTDLHATRPHEAQSMRAHSSLVASVGSADAQGRSSAHVLTDRAPVQLLICVSRLRLQAYITNLHGAPKATRMTGPTPKRKSEHHVI